MARRRTHVLAGKTIILIAIKRRWEKPNTYLPRSYVLPDDKKKWSDARQWCTDASLGLAMWDTADAYEDIKFIAGDINQKVYTALWNPLKNKCSSKSACDTKLVSTSNYALIFQ